MQLLGRDVSDGRLLALVESFLKAGVLEDGEWRLGEDGTPPFDRLRLCDKVELSVRCSRTSTWTSSIT